MRMTRTIVSVCSLTMALALQGCGTYAPEIEEFWGKRNAPDDRGDATFIVNKIAGQVACELARAVQQVYQDRPIEFHQNPGDPPPPPPKSLDWFDKWSVQATLTLTILEQSTLNAGLSTNNILNNATTAFGKTVITTAQSSAVGFGLGGTTAATRTDKLSMFFSVKDLKNSDSAINMSCLPSPPPNATLFVESDLKIYDWLQAALLPDATQIINYSGNSSPQNVIQHEIKFQIVTNGSVTPTWKLVRFTANTSGAFFALDRDRTQDLLITFGPTAPPATKSAQPQLSTAAENAHLAALIGEDVAKAIKGISVSPTQ
jgi:hypothetical protein